MRRRDILAILCGGAVLSSPLVARAQQKAMPVIGILAPNPKVFATLTVERDLAALGWEAGRNLYLVLRASAGTNEALPALAADLIAQSEPNLRRRRSRHNRSAAGERQNPGRRRL
jgi:hypothetical protein